MIPYAIFDLSGRLIQKGSAPHEKDIPDIPDTTVLIRDVGSLNVYLDGLEVKQCGESPGPFHEFCIESKRWIDPRTDEDLWEQVRTTRDRLLAASDWTQLPDVQEETRVKWKDYRQQLRDITLQPDPLHIEWPEEPV